MTEKTQIDIEEILTLSKDQITEQMIQNTKDQIIRSLDWKIQNSVDAIASEVIKNEVEPLVKEKLLAHKTEIAEEIYRGILLSVKALGEKIAEKAIKNVSDSWKLGKIAEELFK